MRNCSKKSFKKGYESRTNILRKINIIVTENKT